MYPCISSRSGFNPGQSTPRIPPLLHCNNPVAQKFSYMVYHFQSSAFSTISTRSSAFLVISARYSANINIPSSHTTPSLTICTSLLPNINLASLKMSSIMRLNNTNVIPYSCLKTCLILNQSLFSPLTIHIEIFNTIQQLTTNSVHLQYLPQTSINAVIVFLQSILIHLSLDKCI